MDPQSLLRTTESLQEMTRLIEDTMRLQGEQERPPPAVFAVYLASFFSYNLDQGGFAQLLYNARGENLAEMEDMLRMANASTALESYLQAISLCTDNLQAYDDFIAGDFRSPSELKNALHAVSIEYFHAGSPFLAEAAGFIAESREPVAEWVRAQTRG